MQRTKALLLTLLLGLAFAAAPAAAYTTSANYYSSFGAGWGPFSFGINFPPGIGGVTVTAPSTYSIVLIDIDDDLFGGDAAHTVCGGASSFVWGVAANFGCIDAQCGPALFPFAPVGDTVTVFLHWFTVTAALDVCFAAQGTVTAVFA